MATEKKYRYGFKGVKRKEITKYYAEITVSGIQLTGPLRDTPNEAGGDYKHFAKHWTEQRVEDEILSKQVDIIGGRKQYLNGKPVPPELDVTTYTVNEMSEGDFSVVHHKDIKPIDAARADAIEKLGEQWIEEYKEGDDFDESESINWDEFLKNAAIEWVKVVKTQ